MHVCTYMCLYVLQYVCMCVHTCVCMCYSMYMYVCTSEFLISFETWAKLAQKWLVCAPLGIHLELVNAVSDNIIIINCATGPKRELCSAK